PPQPATKSARGQDPHISDLLAPPTETATVYGNDRAYRRTEKPGDLFGLAGRGPGVYDAVTGPYLAAMDPQLGAAGLAVDDPHAARPDDDVVDVARRPRRPAIVQNDEAPGQPGQQPGGRHFGVRSPGPAIGIGSGALPPGERRCGHGGGGRGWVARHQGDETEAEGQKEPGCTHPSAPRMGPLGAAALGSSREAGPVTESDPFSHPPSKSHCCDCHTSGENMVACVSRPSATPTWAVRT